MSRLPDSTENNRERITEQENRELDRQYAAELAARFTEPEFKTIPEIFGRIVEKELPTIDALALYGNECYTAGREQGRAEKQSEWDDWIAKRFAEDPEAKTIIEIACKHFGVPSDMFDVQDSCISSLAVMISFGEACMRHGEKQAEQALTNALMHGETWRRRHDVT